MLLRLVAIVMLVAQPLPLRMCGARSCPANRPVKTAVKTCSHARPLAAAPRCGKDCCMRQRPVVPCAFCRNIPREPASPPPSPVRPACEQSPALPLGLVAVAEAGHTGLAEAWSDLAPVPGESSRTLRQACLCVWLI